jgi:hypothetical protein
MRARSPCARAPSAGRSVQWSLDHCRVEEKRSPLRARRAVGDLTRPVLNPVDFWYPVDFWQFSEVVDEKHHTPAASYLACPIRDSSVRPPRAPSAPRAGLLRVLDELHQPSNGWSKDVWNGPPRATAPVLRAQTPLRLHI